MTKIGSLSLHILQETYVTGLKQFPKHSLSGCERTYRATPPPNVRNTMTINLEAKFKTKHVISVNTA